MPNLMAVLFLVIALASCQEDFGSLGSDVIGSESLNAILNDNSTIVAYSKRVGAVQTDGLPLRQLGSYNDPVYGKSKVELISQLTLSTTEPNFGFEPVLDSVVLYLPYLSKSITTTDVTTYTLDSVYGSDPINLKIFESNYFLRDYDPAGGLDDRQKYYSNLKTTISAGGTNIGDLLYEVENFIPNNEGFVLISPDGEDEGDEPDELLVAPGLRIKLPVSFFQEKIIDMGGSSELMSNNNFKEYFRGLYFEVDDQNTDGNTFLFDLSNQNGASFNAEAANISLHFKFKQTETSTDVLNGTLNLTFSGNAVSLFSNDELPADIGSMVDTPNTLVGEETLYLRGGEGIVTIINLFGEDEDLNDVPDQLDRMRSEKWLINEANLILYVDQDKVTGGEAEPDRIFVYDALNLTSLVDYRNDATAGEAPYNAFINHLGPLERGSDENGDFYKIRLTYHISNLIHQGRENVPLAIAVSNNVAADGIRELENSIEIVDPDNPNPDENEDTDLKAVPTPSVIYHKGTVLYGSRSANEEKKLKLQIYYTKPN